MAIHFVCLVFSLITPMRASAMGSPTLEKGMAIILG